MNIDKQIQEILQRSLPVNDNCTTEDIQSSKVRTPAKKTDSLSKSINIVGNQNIIIATNSISMLLLVLLFCAFLWR